MVTLLLDKPDAGLQSRWWEREAGKILKNCVKYEVELLHRFHLYQEEKLPEELGSYSWQWTYTPPTSMNETDAEHIAASLDGQSSSQFLKIPFEDWVRHALGYEVSSVKGFISQHYALRDRLREHVRLFQEAGKYVRVMRVSCIMHDVVLSTLIVLAGIAQAKSFCVLGCVLESLAVAKAITAGRVSELHSRTAQRVVQKEGKATHADIVSTADSGGALSTLVLAFRYQLDREVLHGYCVL